MPVVVGIIFVAAMLWLVDIINPTDNTDDPGGGRSGLSLYTDHLTGCQYLTNGYQAGLTPRLDAEGKIICKK